MNEHPLTNRAPLSVKVSTDKKDADDSWGWSIFPAPVSTILTPIDIDLTDSALEDE